MFLLVDLSAYEATTSVENLEPQQKHMFLFFLTTTIFKLTSLYAFEYAQSVLLCISILDDFM
jgi:hypothetical protein